MEIPVEHSTEQFLLSMCNPSQIAVNMGVYSDRQDALAEIVPDKPASKLCHQG